MTPKTNSSRWFILLWTLVFLLSSIPPAQAQISNVVLVMTIDEAITPASALYFERALTLAERRGATALVLQLNTPGGQLDATFQMTEAMRNSPVPVIVYITPRGAMAGSAGLLLTLAAHANGMAPETTIGAATPVGSNGEDLGEAMQSKVSNIIKANLRAWASWRGEEAIALAEAAIDQAAAASAEEALNANLTDAIAVDLNDLLVQLDGRSVTVQGHTVTLQTARTIVEPVSPSLVEKLLTVLINPNIVFILLTLGIQGILIELSAPGGWAAGTLGIISLALAAYGLGVLPVNWMGMVIMAVAFVLFILDVKAPTHGALTTAGIAAFIGGALVLFNSAATPLYWRVSPWLVGAVGILMGLSFGVIVGFAVRMLRQSGYDPAQQSGAAAIAITDINPTGQVRYQGQVWSAELERGAPPVRAQERVHVVRREGLRLIVRETESADPNRRSGEA